MQLLRTRLKLGKLYRSLVFCLVQILLFLGLASSDFGIAAAEAKPLTLINSQAILAQTYPAAREARNGESLDLDKAADRADEASEKIFKGLDETKNFVGKTEQRKQAIQHGREHASDKWKSIADKARRAKDSEESLTPPEEKVLKYFPDTK